MQKAHPNSLKNLKPVQPGEVRNKTGRGRPKKLPALDKLLADVLGGEDEDTTEAHRILQALIKKAKTGDVRAAEILLERGYGKVKEQIDVSQKGTNLIQIEILKTNERKIDEQSES